MVEPQVHGGRPVRRATPSAERNLTPPRAQPRVNLRRSTIPLRDQYALAMTVGLCAGPSIRLTSVRSRSSRRHPASARPSTSSPPGTPRRWVPACSTCGSASTARGLHTTDKCHRAGAPRARGGTRHGPRGAGADPRNGQGDGRRVRDGRRQPPDLWCPDDLPTARAGTRWIASRKIRADYFHGGSRKP